jgi:hypothetical protein
MFNAQLVPDSPRLGRCLGHQLIGVHECQVAHQNGHALTESPGLASPFGVAVVAGEHGVGGGFTSTACGVVHHVVVEQGERVHQLECCAGVGHHRVGGVAASTHETPVAEGRAESLAAHEDQAADLLHRLG